MQDARWQVPDALRVRWAADPVGSRWATSLPGLCVVLAETWSLSPDGPAWSGFNSAVWPVRDGDGRALALKVTRPGVDISSEAAALRHWAGTGSCVGLLADDEERNALLLERLDGERSLEDVPDVDLAVETVARLLASLPDTPAPSGISTTAAEAARIDAQIAGLDGDVSLPADAVEHARTTLTALRADRTDRLLHFDAHFLNVLRRPGTSGAHAEHWRLIDPLPRTGPVEWEPIALLRNRWADIAATGDPDRALRRRVDQVSEILGIDPALCRDVAQAVAVDNLAHLLRHDPRHAFVAPYAVMATWGAGPGRH